MYGRLFRLYGPINSQNGCSRGRPKCYRRHDKSFSSKSMAVFWVQRWRRATRGDGYSCRYYDHYINAGNVNSGNVFYKTNNHAPHALVTGDGGPCLSFNAQWINDCKYDAAGLLLEHIYGVLNPPGKTLSSSPQAFDQHDFVGSTDPKSIGLADTGYVYARTA